MIQEPGDLPNAICLGSEGTCKQSWILFVDLSFQDSMKGSYEYEHHLPLHPYRTPTHGMR